MRLIPARAGKTVDGWRPCQGGPAHPRACGENVVAGVIRMGRRGSSPRVRGKLDQQIWELKAPRLIPARAGKTPRSTTTSCPAAAHPRACGENRLRAGRILRQAGSSPRVRGKRRRRSRVPGGVGLIPARAGKTSRRRSRGRPCSAHPRACGENLPRSTTQAACRGSSPRVRGKPPPSPARTPKSGLIPARAGKTVGVGVKRDDAGAHPRACGENKDEEQAALPTPWLIPARAGKTSPASTSPTPHRAHPRACGENGALDPVRRDALGSSPRVRGKRQ